MYCAQHIGYPFFFRRGSFLNSAIFLYALTSPVCGYVGGALYSRMGGGLHTYCTCTCYMYVQYVRLICSTLYGHDLHLYMLFSAVVTTFFP